MGVFENIYFKINSNRKDITERFNDLLLKEGFTLKMFMDTRRHVIYSRGNIELDFWWERGNRPTLFIRNSGEMVRSDIYDKLIQKHGSKNAPIGKVSHYVYSKLDKDLYFDEHYYFVSNYIKQA